MPIYTEPIPEVQLPNPDALNNWIDKTQKSLHRLPILGLMEHGAEFHDDEYLGIGDVFKGLPVVKTKKWVVFGARY